MYRGGSRQMSSTSRVGLRVAVGCLALAGWQIAGGPDTAWAQVPPPVFLAPPPPGPPPAAAPPAEAPAGPTALTTPSMTGPLVANPTPIVVIDQEPIGKIYAS